MSTSFAPADHPGLPLGGPPAPSKEFGPLPDATGLDSAAVCAQRIEPEISFAAVGLCRLPAFLTVTAAAPEAGAPAPTIVPPAPVPVVETVVVHARIGSAGAVEVLGDPEVDVNTDVLSIVARELAYPQQLRRGTPIELVYQGATRRKLTAVHIGRGVGARHAFYFRSPTAGVEGFFSRDGQSLEHRFLRYPLAYERITSPFSRGRRHPILRSVRPHQGVDFAAKPGTAVLAVGSGKVRSAAWQGRFGRTVEIEHDGGYVSRYSHLQRFAAGLRAGGNVRKGQVIGYVGTSGMTTGPHLHFEMVKHGGYLDPLGRDLPKRSALDVTALGAFRGAVARIDHAIAAAATEKASAIAGRHDAGRDPRG